MKKKENLLKKVGELVQKAKELSILKGENFNIFQIFEMERDENRMHSRFIETLLNPKGCHDRGNVFLKLFLKTISKEKYFEILEKVNTKVEHSIGKVDISKGEESTGGRIDIYLWDGKKSISIENKIDALDQPKQIIRYYNHNKKNNEVYYLTKKGGEPSDKDSYGSLKSNLNKDIEKPDFYCISYSETILEWLKKCQKETSDYPIIRESIKQYIITIKRITGQLINQKMGKDITALVKNNYESAIEISNKIESAKIEITDEFLNRLKDTLEENLGENWKITKEDIYSGEYKKIWIRRTDWIPDVAIVLEGYKFFWKEQTILGLLSGKKNELAKSSLKEVLNEIKKKYTKTEGHWLFYGIVFNLGNDHEFIELVRNDKKFTEKVYSEIRDLIDEINDYLVK